MCLSPLVTVQKKSRQIAINLGTGAAQYARKHEELRAQGTRFTEIALDEIQGWDFPLHSTFGPPAHSHRDPGKTLDTVTGAHALSQS